MTQGNAYPMMPGQIGEVTWLEAIEFVHTPHMVTRRMNDIITEDRLLSHYLLSGRWEMVGGALILEEELATPTPTGESEIVAPGAEYPTMSVEEAGRRLAFAQKIGGARELTDEAVKREGFNKVESTLRRICNKGIRDWESTSMSVIKSAAVPEYTSQAWTDPDVFLTEVDTAKVTMVELDKDFDPTEIIVTERQWIALKPIIKKLLPDADTRIVNDEKFNLCGLTWHRSRFLPTDWVPTLMDREMFGGIGHETLPAKKYCSVEGGLVEVKVTDLERVDGVRIQWRKTDVPIIRNVDAALRVKGAFQ